MNWKTSNKQNRKKKEKEKDEIKIVRITRNSGSP